MKIFNKTIAILLSFIFIFLSASESLRAFAEALNKTDTTTIQNDFIKVTVDNATGRYGIRTLEGQPIRKNDQDVNLTFRGDDPETSFTTFKIDGTDYIYGNKYKFDDKFYSTTTAPAIVQNPNGTKQLEMTWSIKGVEIKQILMLYTDTKDKMNSGNVNIRYEVNNKSGAQVQVGTRILLDTMVGGTDGPAFQIGTTYESPLTVERKLVHDPAAIGIPEEDVNFYKLPAYWVMRDKQDLTNPLATNVIAYGFNNFAEQNINIVDEMIVGHWNGLANTKWDYTVHPNLDFTRDTNDYGSADSAVAFYWNPQKIAPKGFQSFETVYGLGEIVEQDKVFSIRYLDPVQQLATLDDNSGYVDDGVFDITAEIENLPAYNMEHERIDVQLTLDSGLDFVQIDNTGQIVRDSDGKPKTLNVRSQSVPYKKKATPEEAEQGIQPKYKPGDAITATFKVKAKGKPWPTTKAYMMTVSSPQTQEKFLSEKDDGIKAQYSSSKSGFILLPPVGEGTPTYVYGLAPKELYSTDVKYMTVNLSNIEAYNTGNETTAPNFDLYLKEVVTGKRYKVPVKESVLLQPTDDGATGDMRITYRGGDLVDAGGNVIEAGRGPELPLGQYQVQIDYKGDAGGDEEQAALYDITSTQKIMVTDNSATRIREAGILALYKERVDISGLANGGSVKGALLDQLNSLYPNRPFKDGAFLFDAVTEYKKTKTLVGAASKAVDPRFKLDKFLDAKSLEEVPLYNYKLFDSDAELAAFIGEKGFKRENLVTVRGMVKQVGTGADQQIIVDTKTEPAIINDAVAYKGKDLAFVRGKLDVFGQKQTDKMPFMDTVFLKGDGTLSVASSGFIFHKGEWTLDFFNGFEKSLVDKETELDPLDNPEDNTLNGSLKWALGNVGDRLNPLRQVMIEDIYFNKRSLFTAPSFSISGFGLTFNDYILRKGGISFGGMVSFKVLDAEIQNVVFNKKGFVGIDAALKYNLSQNVGLFGPKKNDKNSGELSITHYVQPVEDKANSYGIKFNAELKDVVEVNIELALKQVADGRILPDVIAFGTSLPEPGILLTGATYLTDIRGAVRELADTIAGGTGKDPFPLVVQAGVGIRFGIAPAYFFGDIDLTLKRTGIKLQGKMDFSTKPDADKDERLPMLTKALIEAQWVTPWFVRLEAAMDIGGWDIIIGKAGIFVGQNLEKNRTDFEGYIGSKVQIPSSVPVVGGMPLSSMFLGVNNDKVWGSIGILFISLGITYYWGGGIEFGTSSEQLPDGLIHLKVDDPELGPRLMVIGQGVETLATSWVDTEKEQQGITYHDVEKGVQYLENGSVNVGVGGITVKNGGRVHEITMDGVTGNALIEMEYTSKTMPEFSLKDASGKLYPVKFDNTNTDPTANAFTQFVPAEESIDKVDVRKAYVIIPADVAKKGGKWTLTALSAVETKLLNVPTAPQLNDVSLAKDGDNANKFTASWKVANAKADDKISLYLTTDAVSNEKTTINGNEVLETGDPGVLIAKDIPVASNGSLNGSVTSGSATIDVTKVSMLGNVEDIRGLLKQGNYYVRAELQSEAAFGTKTSAQKFEIVDPLAPGAVSDVSVEPAGNGWFSLSFKPAANKAGQAAYAHSYVVDAKREEAGKWTPYANFGEMLFTEDELKPYWNASSGRYEGIPIGGWSATTLSNKVNTDSLTGSEPTEKVEYVGLEVGHEYRIGVSATTTPTAADDPRGNYHYANRVESVTELLPVPALPRLTIGEPAQLAANGGSYELLTNKTKQSISIVSDQKDVTVEAYYAENSIGKTTLSDGRGKLDLTQFQTDGTYAIELRATNTKTKDVSVTMLYLTVDTIAPILYIDSPTTGERTEGGAIEVAGTTTVGSTLSVNGTKVSVADDGTFKQSVPVAASSDPNVALSFVATDGAGNENQAVVDITNDGLEIPVALILKPLPKMNLKDKQSFQAYLKVADGKDENGKIQYAEKLVEGADLARLNYNVVMGDAVDLTADGQATAVATGSSLIEASYRISDEVSLQGMAIARVEVPEPTALESLSASTAPIPGDTANTRINVTSSGDMTGQQLAYKVYPSGADLPAFKEDVTAWTILPADGVVPAKSGDTIVVVKRTSLTKLAMAAAQVRPSIWVNSFSGGGGGGPTAEKPVVTVNGQSIEAEWEGSTAVIRLTDKDISAVDSDLSINFEDATVQEVDVRVAAGIVQKVVAAKKNIVIALPAGRLVLTSEQLTGMTDELVVKLGSNSNTDIDKIGAISKSQGFTVLGSGQGMHLSINLKASNWKKALALQTAIPAGMKSGDVTAVVLLDAAGNWTTVPWKTETNGGKINVHLTGEGSVFFVSNHKNFVDVNEGWAKQSIADAAAKLFVLGRSADRFAPQDKVTRAEYPTILLRVAGLMNGNVSAAGFDDVRAGAWYDRSVSIAASLGIVNGQSGNNYAPQATLSRIEAMTMVGRLLQATGTAEELSEADVAAILSIFSDKERIPEWAKKSVAMSVKYGIILGESNRINPADALTRAQAAAIANRLDQFIVNQD